VVCGASTAAQNALGLGLINPYGYGQSQSQRRYSKGIGRLGGARLNSERSLAACTCMPLLQSWVHMYIGVSPERQLCSRLSERRESTHTQRAANSKCNRHVKIQRHQHARVHAHTGPRRHVRAPARRKQTLLQSHKHRSPPKSSTEPTERLASTHITHELQALSALALTPHPHTAPRWKETDGNDGTAEEISRAVGRHSGGRGRNRSRTTP